MRIDGQSASVLLILLASCLASGTSPQERAQEPQRALSPGEAQSDVGDALMPVSVLPVQGLVAPEPEQAIKQPEASNDARPAVLIAKPTANPPRGVPLPAAGQGAAPKDDVQTVTKVILVTEIVDPSPVTVGTASVPSIGSGPRRELSAVPGKAPIPNNRQPRPNEPLVSIAPSRRPLNPVPGKTVVVSRPTIIRGPAAPRDSVITVTQTIPTALDGRHQETDEDQEENEEDRIVTEDEPTTTRSLRKNIRPTVEGRRHRNNLRPFNVNEYRSRLSTSFVVPQGRFVRQRHNESPQVHIRSLLSLIMTIAAVPIFIWLI